MPGTQTQSRSPAPAPAQPQLRKRYEVARQEDVWFITFGGERFGPYKTEREAKLFAIDAAYKLGEQGEETEVLVRDEAGLVTPVWVYGQHAYPPRE
jgi:hypothetical protein